MRPPRRKAPVRRGTQPVPALERQPRGPQHLGPAAAERQSPGSVTPSPAWPPVIATPSVGVPFHRTSEYLRSYRLLHGREIVIDGLDQFCSESALFEMSSNSANAFPAMSSATLVLPRSRASLSFFAFSFLFSARSRVSSADSESCSSFSFFPPGFREPAACCRLQSSR